MKFINLKRITISCYSATQVVTLVPMLLSIYTPSPPIHPTGTYNQNIHVYDVNTYQSIKALVGHIGTVTGLAPAATGKLLFSASYDTTVQVQSRDCKVTYTLSSPQTFRFFKIERDTTELVSKDTMLYKGNPRGKGFCLILGSKQLGNGVLNRNKYM